MSIKNILDFCEKNSTRIYIKIPKGLFIRSNDILFLSEAKLDDDQLNKLNSNINFSKSELVTDNYSLAFKQITEIAVKAMSPGINDPGTAINAIDYLTELFALRMKKRDADIFVNEKKKAQFKTNIIKFNVLLFNVMASLVTYSKKDPIIVQKLLWMLEYLSNQEAYNETYIDAVKDEIGRLRKRSKAIIDELVTIQ